MRRTTCFFVLVTAACAQLAMAQDESEVRMRKALVGRSVLVKMDLPAIETGIELYVDDNDVSYAAPVYNNLIKEFGVAIKGQSRARITAARISKRGIEIDLDGGGAPGPEWAVGGLRLVEPAPVARSDREIELERQALGDQSPGMATYVRAELDYERQRRLAQDERNRQAFENVAHLRSQYIKENRKNWGAKVIVVVRSTKSSITMRDMVKSLGKYVELLPIEKPAK